MINSTLCYVTRGNEVLMLHRVKKKNDINKDKWIGIGGKFEENESPDECLLREALEETGLRLTSWRCRGIVTFLTNGPWEGEYMYLERKWGGNPAMVKTFSVSCSSLKKLYHVGVLTFSNEIIFELLL